MYRQGLAFVHPFDSIAASHTDPSRRGASVSVHPAPTVLARDRLGTLSVVYFVLSGVAPLTVAAGVVPTAFVVTGLTPIPVAFLAVAAVLGVWAVGYVTMARYVTNAGAFSAFLARGLGRPAGVAAAFVAVLAYNLLQVGLYGVFGPFIAARGPAGVPWWAYALGAWALVAL